MKRSKSVKQTKSTQTTKKGEKKSKPCRWLAIAKMQESLKTK
jgi:hypothetical protein